MPSWSSRKSRSPSRTTAWSSTISTRIASAIACDQQHHGRAGAGRRADLQPPAEPRGALLHRGQAEVARAHSGAVRVEPDAVVARPRRRARPGAGQANGHVLGAGVADARCAAPPGRSAARNSRSPSPFEPAGAALRRLRARSRSRARARASRRACAARPRARRARARAGAARGSASAARRAPRAASSRVRSTCARAASGSRSSSVAAASAVSTTLNSFWLTTSWSSSASRLRSERIDSSRLRSYRRAFVIAIAACAASSSISSSSSSSKLARALLLGQVEGADHAVGGDDRHAEERAHVRVARGPPAAEARIVVDVLGAVRARPRRASRRASRACAAADPSPRSARRSSRTTRKRRKPPSPSGIPSAA